MDIPYIFRIYSTYIYIYIFPKYVPYIFPFVCYLIYGVKSRSGHDRSQSFGQIPHASRIPTSPQRATFMENEYGWFMCVYGMSFVSSEILKPEPRKHKKIKAQSSEVGTNYRPK